MRPKLFLRPALIALAAILLPAATAVLSPRADADIVYLKNGGVLRGEIVKEDEATITLRVTYGTVIIQREHVRLVEKESALGQMLEQADALAKAGQTDEAIAKLEDALKRFPESASARDKLIALYKSKAARLVERGDRAAADKLYRRVLELMPTDAEAEAAVRRTDDVKKTAPPREDEALLLASIGRSQEALEMFDELKAVPDVAERDAKAIAKAHAGYGRRLLELKRYKAAKAQFQQAVKLDPTLLNDLSREMIVSQLLPLIMEINEKAKDLSKGRWEAIAAELSALLTLDPKDDHLHYALAVCYHELGQYADAAKEYAAVTGEEPPPADRLPEALKGVQFRAKTKVEAAPITLSFGKTEFAAARPGKPQVLETKHFVIHYQNDELGLLVSRAAEYYLDRNYRIFLDRPPEKPWAVKCDIVIYATQEEYMKNTGQASWSPAMASATGMDGVLSRHFIKTYQTSRDLLPSDLSHEITHIIHSAVLGYSGAIPTWLREGTAVKSEPSYKHLRVAGALREARTAGKLMTLEQIMNQSGYPKEDLVNVFYAQSYALVEAVYRSGTRDQFTLFCKEALRGDALKAFQLLYGTDARELDKRWQKQQDDLISLLD